jgi:ketosteroid isomerase-like protein
MAATQHHARLIDWIDRYERAWRSPGTDALNPLFTTDATYRPAPFDEPIRGHDAIAAFWEAEREGPDEDFTLTSDVIAVDGDTGVARIEVEYGRPVSRRYRDLWIITLHSDGRCRVFEEWPFFLGQPRVAPSSWE